MKIFEASIGSEQILVCQYGPTIQIHSALDSISKEYFLRIFKSKNPNIKEFAHSYVPKDPSGKSMGLRMVVYSDSRIVLGKAPNHAYLVYQPESVGSKVEGYYNANKKMIIFSGEENNKYSQVFNKTSWKTIFSRLSMKGLIDDNWKVKGCPPVCGEREIISAGEIISGHWDSEVGGKEKTLKSKDAESIVQRFITTRAIQSKDTNPRFYFYRYGENLTFAEFLSINNVKLPPSGK